MALTSVETYHNPDNEAAVVQLLQQYEDSALIVAGGTFLHGLAARGLLSGVEALIDIQNLDLSYITANSDGVVIGATTRFAQLEEDGSVGQQPWLGAVKDAIGYPPVQIMNAATVGGSIAASCPFFDLPTSFLALDGAVRAHGPGGSRDIPMEAFFAGLFENCLAPDEFVTAITLPQPAAGSARRIHQAGDQCQRPCHSQCCRRADPGRFEHMQPGQGICRRGDRRNPGQGRLRRAGAGRRRSRRRDHRQGSGSGKIRCGPHLGPPGVCGIPCGDDPGAGGQGDTQGARPRRMKGEDE